MTIEPALSVERWHLAIGLAFILGVPPGQILAQDGVRTHEYPGKSPRGIESLTVSPDGKSYAISVIPGQSIEIRDMDTGKITLRVSRADGFTTAMAFSPDSKSLASAGADCEKFLVRVVDLARAPDHFDLKEMGTAASLCFSSNGKLLAVGQINGGVRVWDLEKRNLVFKLEAKGDPANLAFSPDSKTLAVAGREGKLSIWDPLGGKLITELKSSEYRDLGVQYSLDGKELYAGNVNGELRIWKISEPKAVRTVTFKDLKLPADVFAISADGKLVAWSQRTDRPRPYTIAIGDARTGKIVKEFTHAKDTELTQLVFTPDGKKLISGLVVVVFAEHVQSLCGVFRHRRSREVHSECH